MSNTLVVRYTVRPEAADENQRLVKGVQDALAALQPSGVTYTVYRLGEDFIHIATHDGDDNPITSLSEFKEFQKDLPSRCIAPPQALHAALVGAYPRSA